MTTTRSTKRLDPHDADPNSSIEGPGAYERLDLIELMTRIVEGDRLALETLVAERRPVFRHGRPMGLPDWIEAVSQADAVRRSAGDEVVALARDLLYDRFTRLPATASQGTCNGTDAQGVTAGASSGGEVLGVDCRNYYRGFLNHLPSSILPPGARGRHSGVHSSTHQNPAMSRIDNNAWIHRRFSGFVNRHWGLCQCEARRRLQRLTVAYDYRMPGATLRLWVPACIPSRQRRAWLERNFGPVCDIADDADQAHHRLQSQINQWLDHALRERERNLRLEMRDSPFGAGQPLSTIERAWTQEGLATTVANEKANAPQRLRTSIAALGAERIKALVLSIFDGITEGTYHPATTARDYGLHKSTLTRFAASRWQPGDDGPVPDLWLNTAQVLASQARFVAALEEAGLEHLVLQLARHDP